MLRTEQKLPPLKLPLFYEGFALLCFAAALCGIFAFAEDFTGFYYHPHILALTHLVTLGWISGSIIGTLYIIAPMALHSHLSSRTVDVVACLFFVIGVLGMVAHFWMDRPIGMAWSAGCVYLSILFVGVKVLRTVRGSKLPGFVKMHLTLAFLNFFGAGTWGLLLAIHKAIGFLPTSSSPNVLAHAHLAAVGWATMMVFGVAYRLLPMFLPAEPAKGKLPWYSGILMEIGIIGLFLSTLFELGNTWIFATLIAAGISLFFLQTAQTFLRMKAAPPPLPPRPDFSMLHAPYAFLCLAVCVVIGMFLSRIPSTEETLKVALAYGVLGLIGFLGQMVVGLKPKIFSIFTWYYSFSTAERTQIPRPIDMPVRAFQASIFFLWLIGLPLLVTGIWISNAFVIRAGAILLAASLLIHTINEVVILKLIAAARRVNL